MGRAAWIGLAFLCLAASAGFILMWLWMLKAAPLAGASLSFLMVAGAVAAFAGFIATSVFACINWLASGPPPPAPRVAPCPDEKTALTQ